MSPAGGASALEVRIDAKRFAPVGDAPAQLVLKDFRLTVAPNDFLALFGPSGCGKTTALNIMAGLDRDFQGRLERPKDGRIAYVFQEPRLLPWLTVEDNLKLVLSDAVLADGNRADRLIEEWLGLMDLADVRQVYPNRLSLGMARLVALARDFITRPTLLLMDEPFVSLDEATAVRLRRLLLSTLETHPAAVVFVTHNLREAVMLADRIAILAPPPSRVMREIELPLTAAERLDEAAIEAVRQRILGEADLDAALSPPC
jgi:NitT/TauT family transport system ATP-binding protein